MEYPKLNKENIHIRFDPKKPSCDLSKMEKILQAVEPILAYSFPREDDLIALPSHRIRSINEATIDVSEDKNYGTKISVTYWNRREDGITNIKSGNTFLLKGEDVIKYVPVTRLDDLGKEGDHSKPMIMGKLNLNVLRQRYNMMNE